MRLNRAEWTSPFDATASPSFSPTLSWRLELLRASVLSFARDQRFLATSALVVIGFASAMAFATTFGPPPKDSPLPPGLSFSSIAFLLPVLMLGIHEHLAGSRFHHLVLSAPVPSGAFIRFEVFLSVLIPLLTTVSVVVVVYQPYSARSVFLAVPAVVLGILAAAAKIAAFAPFIYQAPSDAVRVPFPSRLYSAMAVLTACTALASACLASGEVLFGVVLCALLFAHAASDWRSTYMPSLVSMSRHRRPGAHVA